MKITDLIKETFKDSIKGTVFTRKEIIKKVIEKDNNVNEGSVIPSDYCYNRWNKGVSETKRLCLFEYIDTADEKKYRYLGTDYIYTGKVYHKAKGEVEKCVGEWVNGVFSEYKNELHIKETSMFNKDVLKKYVTEYKKNIKEWRFGQSREIYKWEAVEHFKNNWNIDKPDFVGMLKEALGKTENLLTVGMFYARAMLLGLSEKEPETVRGMFRNLYDDSKDLQKRVSAFMEQADELHKRNPGGKSHYQGIRAISVYLWLMYPEKYYIYQYAIYDNVIQKLEADYKIKKDGKPETLLEGYKFFDEIRQELSKDKELVLMNQENGIEGFKDEDLTTLTEDVVFYIRCQEDSPEKEEQKVMIKYPKNLILYGPPGTGKTYNSVNYAVAIVENKTVDEIKKEDRKAVLDRFEQYKETGLVEFCTFHQSFGYEEFIEGIKPVVENGNVLYKVQDGIFKDFCNQEATIIPQNKVFIIDEINRGNISKIFGELITLIEDSKRIGADEEMRTRLPYSGEKFGVPNNVYLLGTMNTADRSIALIDTALRRRFKFVEMQPNVELVDVEVEGVKIKDMLEMINRRIEVLYDREHTIGHSFFMGLTDESTVADLAEVFDCNVIPLLKEYFYDDYERIAAVLDDNLIENDEATNFIIKQDNDYAKILNSDITVMTAYKFNRKALENPNAYKKIYE